MVHDRWPDSTVYSVVVVVLQGKRTWVMTGHCQSWLNRDRQDPGRPVQWEWTRPDHSRLDWNWLEQTLPNWTSDYQTRPDWTRLDWTRPDWNEPDKTGPNLRKLDWTLPDRTKPKQTIPDRTTPHCRKPHQNGSNGYCTCTAVRTKDQNEMDGASPDWTRVEWNKM